MRNHEFLGFILQQDAKWPGMRGNNIVEAILNTLDEYEGDDDDVLMNIIIVPKLGGPSLNSPIDADVSLMSVDLRWDDKHEAWQVLKYH